jgi:(E)-4-hydroxy-3-methylbut-2-enyl-diphosphate synthase
MKPVMRLHWLNILIILPEKTRITMTEIKRKETRPVKVGTVTIGSSSPVSIQTMTNVPLEKTSETVRQINRLAQSGADIVRVAVRTVDSVASLKKIIHEVSVPLTADVHFDYRIAIESIKAGVHKIRINPGNIGKKERVLEVVKAARDYGVAIRIGVNGGSIDRKKFPEVTPESLVLSAVEHIDILEDHEFTNIVVSIKSSHILETVEANRLFSSRYNYPLHIGLTEAGFGNPCIINSSIAIGTLLMEGIGDTIRVSMTGDPVEEVSVARGILEAVGERRPVIRMVACPTCGRTDEQIDLRKLAETVESAVIEKYKDTLVKEGKQLTLAVMGCEVNGPGEAKDADIGIAGAGNGRLMLFAKGERIKNIDIEDAIATVLDEIENKILK